MNKVMIVGNLGTDVAVRYIPSGTTVCDLRVATNESWKDKVTGETRTATEWHKVVCWAKTAENCAKYLKKGRKVQVEGSLRTRVWEDKDNNKRYTTEIVARTVKFL